MFDHQIDGIGAFRRGLPQGVGDHPVEGAVGLLQQEAQPHTGPAHLQPFLQSGEGVELQLFRRSQDPCRGAGANLVAPVQDAVDGRDADAGLLGQMLDGRAAGHSDLLKESLISVSHEMRGKRGNDAFHMK